ncbi:MAG: FtsW/RodA/SpoVE family cell cycle protein, partial [Rhodoglobus sp.]
MFLVVFGLVMVLSSSSIESRADGGDFFSQAARQGLYALVGVPAMLLAARAPIAFWKRWAGIAVVIGVALQLLVFLPGLGYERGQNRNWINLGSFTAQPSELIKLALVIWLAWVLSRRSPALGVLVARGAMVTASPQSAEELLFAAEEARDRLLLPAAEPGWAMFDALFPESKKGGDSEK